VVVLGYMGGCLAASFFLFLIFMERGCGCLGISCIFAGGGWVLVGWHRGATLG